MKRLYVGMNGDGKRGILRTDATPTRESHGHLWDACIGPFRTKRAAVAFCLYGFANPHMGHVDDIERVAAHMARTDANLSPESVRRYGL